MSKLDCLMRCLVERYGLSRKEAEEFVTTIFAVVRDRIDRDKIVKVKGLGTFKLADVNARESIDVNTKERIVIEGRAKLSFTPENAVRDRINSPFSQFETVDLDDDMDFTSIDEKYNEKDEEEASAEEAPVEEVAVEQAPVVEEVPVEETTTADVSSEEIKEEEPPVAETPSEEVKPVEEAPMEEEPAEEESHVEDDKQDKVEHKPEEVKPSIVEQVEEEKKEEVASAKPATTVVPARNPFCEELIREGITHSREIIRLLYLLVALVVIVLLIGAVCLGYKMGTNAAVRESEQARPATPHKTVVVHRKHVVQKPADAPPTVDTLQQKPQEKPSTEVKDVKGVNKEETIKTSSQDAMQAEYNKDVRVRTGAYCIVGLDKVVKLSAGQTFEGICRSRLGEGMECYVEVFNGGKKDFKTGDEIKIPLLKLKKRMKQ